MRIDRKSLRMSIAIGIATALMIIPAPRCPLVLYNRTTSLPIGWYLYRGASIHRGDVVAFALPKPAYSYARLRGESTSVLLLKYVLATRGDFVSTLHGELRINGMFVGPITSVDSADRPLPHWIACRILTDDELLVGSRHPHSFDSRYFGPIHVDQVLGVYHKLAFAAPSKRGSRGNPLALKHLPLKHLFLTQHPPPTVPAALDCHPNDECLGLQEMSMIYLGQVKGAAVNASRNSRVYRELGLAIPGVGYRAIARSPCCSFRYD